MMTPKQEAIVILFMALAFALGYQCCEFTGMKAEVVSEPSN